MSEIVSQEQEVLDKAVHGAGDRNVYYKNWDSFAISAAATVEEEEKEFKRKAEELVANKALSEEHKRDLDKRAALREAKKQWDGVSAGEEAMKVVIENEVNQPERVLHYEKDLDSRRVVVLRNNSGCCYELTEINLTKVFIEHCNNCTIYMNCNLKTSNIEISHCENVVLIVGKYPSHTVQVDISQNISIYYENGLFTEHSKVYHASVSSLRIEYNYSSSERLPPGVGLVDNSSNRYQLLDDFELAKLNPHILPRNQQFVTSFYKNDLVTDYVLRDAGGHVTTQREIEDRKKAVEDAVLEKGLDINSVEVQKVLHEYDPLTPMQLGVKYKEEGNKAFKELDYGQASVHYTQAVECCLSIVSEDTSSAEFKELLCTVYSNRAFSLLKLGDHENALADTNACLEINPNHSKAIFRKGLALHALCRYREACPFLGRALELNPGDKQIKTALVFAERKAQLEASGRK